MKNLIILVAVLLGLSGCNQAIKNENAALKQRTDSLETQLETSQYNLAILEQVGLYLDSIEAQRKWIEINLESGISQKDFVERMKDLNVYIQKTEWTIADLEKTRSAYAAQVSRLKNSLNEKSEEVQSLQLQVSNYQNENRQLTDSLRISEIELVNTRLELGAQLDEAKTENQELNLLAKLSEAETYYIRGQGKEEVAKNIFLAPKKKKQTLEDALEYYSIAYKMGYAPAKTKVDNLEIRLN